MPPSDPDDWSPQSIFDAGDDEEAGASQLAAARPLSHVRDEDAAVHAQIADAAMLAQAEAALARLDEKLAGTGFADGFAERIATTEAEALGRLLGWRGRVGDSALRFRYDAALEDEDDAWTRWAGRMLAAPVLDVAETADAAELAARLRASGWQRMDALEATDDGAYPMAPDHAERQWLQTWLEAVRAFAEMGPAARGAMSYHAWVSGGAGDLTTRLTGAVLAMRLGAGASLKQLRFTPVALAANRLQPLQGELGSAERLARWCRAVSESCRAHAAEVDDLLAWRREAFEAERTKTGRGIVDLLLRQRHAMSEDVAAALGVTVQGANHRLRAMREAGLVTTVDEGRRFRRWTAAGLRDDRRRARAARAGAKRRR
jgi:DNA-binding transcriptional ArsR family regulator